MPSAQASLVQGASRQALPFGLFSALTFRDEGEGRWQSGVSFETLGCGTAQGIGSFSADPEVPTTGLPKQLPSGSGEIGEASEFTIYHHFNCSPVGWTPAQAQGRALERLLVHEEARVEQALWTGDLGNVPSLASASTVELSSTAVSTIAGVVLLEEFIASTYGSLGMLHMTRGMATALIEAKVVVPKGNRLLTPLGTPVIAGSGYPGTGPADEAVSAGQSWVYATPALFGYRSEVFTSSNNPGDLLSKGTNDLYAVAERTYLLGFDPCGVAAVLIDPCADCTYGTPVTTTTTTLA